jgi:polysaccharide export outer membrane protein
MLQLQRKMKNIYLFFLLGMVVWVQAACGGASKGMTGSSPGAPSKGADAAVVGYGAGGPKGKTDYRLGVGDLLSISVWKDEALTRNVVVLPDGTLSFPLVGRVRAEGVSMEELKEVMTRKLARYVPNPALSIQVNSVNSLDVYVIGKVNRPGRFDLKDNVNVLQALAMAQGLNTFAKAGKIKIFRKTLQGTRIFDFDYDDVVNGEDLEQNIRLQRGDIIVVP